MNSAEIRTQINKSRRYLLDKLIGGYLKKHYDIPRRDERDYDVIFRIKYTKTIAYILLTLSKPIFRDHVQNFIDPKRRPFEYIEVYKEVDNRWERVFKDTLSKKD